MIRFFLTMLIASSALHATTTTFSSCSAGTTTISPCPGGLLFPGGIIGPDYGAIAGAEASDNSSILGLGALGGLPTIPSGYVMSVGAVAAAYSSGPNPELSAIAHADASNVFYSAGPSRLGFIQFDVALSHLHGGGSDVGITDGTHLYGYDAEFCGFEGCQRTAIVPFDLGSAFQISTSAGVEENLEPTSDPCCGGSAHGYDDALIVFRLLESDGTTPVPFSITPEPASWGLLLLGMAAGACFACRKRLSGYPLTTQIASKAISARHAECGQCG